MSLHRDEISDALIEQWAALQSLLDTLADADWTTPSALPGWTVHDIVSHVIGTEAFLLGEPVPPALDAQPDHVRNPMGEFNERWVVALRTKPPGGMRTLFRDVTKRREQAMHAMSDEQWQAETASPIGPTTYLRFMRIRVFDCWMHELDIRDAMQLPSATNGQRAQIAFREIPFALGFVVGKKAKVPEGTRISFRLTGGLEQTINVEVAARAEVVEQLSGPATTTITLDSGLFVRLCGGRVRPADHVQSVRFDGDEALGRRIVDNLAFTI